MTEIPDITIKGPFKDETGKTVPFITLVRGGETVPMAIPAAGSSLVPFHAGETLGWRLLAD